jgi:hypothetical protein
MCRVVATWYLAFVSNTKYWKVRLKAGNTVGMKSHRLTQQNPQAKPARGGRWLAVCLSFVLGCAATFAAWPPFGQRHAASARAGLAAEPPRQPVTIEQLLALPDASRRSMDIGRMNIVCANGLPGAEGLDVDKHLATLDEWAKAVRRDTHRHLYQFRERPADFEDSEAYFRMLMLTTVIQQDFGVRYNAERVRDPDFRDSRDLFIHGLLDAKHTGTCVSMPVLTVALGRRLGYPLTLALARSHVFVRRDDGRSKPANFEATSQGLLMYDDDFYANWPEPLSERDLASGAYLRSLTPDEELAVFLQARGHCLEDLGRWPEAQVAYAHAHLLGSKLPYALAFLAEAVRKEIGGAQTRSLAIDSRRLPSSRRVPDPAEVADRINAENAARLRGLMSPDTQLPNSVPSTSIPTGDTP